MNRRTALAGLTLGLIGGLCVFGSGRVGADDAAPATPPSDVAPLDPTPTAMTIGSRAPALDITHWVKGVEMDRRGYFTPVTDLQAGQVYVIEFWATWCPPCVAGMPHLSKLQAQHKEDVTIIGVSDESLPKVTQFLFQTYKRDGKLQNDRTQYMLTTDPDQSVKKDYFLAAEQTGIPCAFVVGRDGIVEWIGHPGKMDDALAAVVAGTWDRESFKGTFIKEQAEKRALRQANTEVRAARKAGDWDKVVAVYDGLIEKMPDAVSPRYQRFLAMLTHTDRATEAYTSGARLLELSWDKSSMLNQIAWIVVDHKDIKVRDLAFALKAIERANELTESKDAAVLDTLARVYFDKGELDSAIAWQQKAAEHAKDDAMGTQIRQVLEKYKAAREAQQAQGAEPAEPVVEDE